MQQLPKRMGWEEFGRRVQALIEKLSKNKGVATREDRSESMELFPWEYNRFLEAMMRPPAICSACGASYQSAMDDCCYDCSKKREREKLKQELRKELENARHGDEQNPS